MRFFMKNRIFVLLAATILTPYASLAMDPPNEFKNELTSIRAQYSQRIGELDQGDSQAVFKLAEELSHEYKGLGIKLCSKTMERHPEVKDTVSVALCGSVAWGEPNLHSDIEVIYLVKDYTNVAQVFNFALDFADEVKKIGDKYFILDQISTKDLEENPLSILQKPPAIFTKEDIEKFCFHTKSFDTTQEYLGHISKAINDPEVKNELQSYNVISSVQKKLTSHVTFTHSLFNLDYLVGNEDLFKAYDYHFQSLVKQPISKYVDLKLEMEESNQRDKKFYEEMGWSYKESSQLPMVSSDIVDKINKIPSKFDFDDTFSLKLCWRFVSNTIRCLGFTFGAPHEKGTLNTLNTIKSTKLQGTKGTLESALSEDSYQDLLQKSTLLTWARLTYSTLNDDPSKIDDLIKTLGYLYDSKVIADFVALHTGRQFKFWIGGTKEF